MSQAHKVNDFIKAFIKDNGVPDLLINNAGAGAFFEWSAFPEEEIQRQIDLLFATPVILCRALAPEMAKEKRENCEYHFFGSALSPSIHANVQFL